MSPRAWGQALATSSSCDGGGMSFGGADSHCSSWKRVCFPHSSGPQTLQCEQLSRSLGVHPRFPPLPSAWDGHPFTQISFQPVRLGAVAPARQRVLGNTTVPCRGNNLPGPACMEGLEKAAFCSLIKYHLALAPHPSHSQHLLGPNLLCPPQRHSPSAHRPLSNSPRLPQRSLLPTSLKSHSWSKCSEAPPAAVPSCLSTACCHLLTSPCLRRRRQSSTDRASRGSSVDPQFLGYNRCSIKKTSRRHKCCSGT